MTASGVVAAEGSSPGPIVEARQCFSHGRYRDGRWVLVRALKDKGLEPGRRLELLLALADFWENLAGRPDEALAALEEAAGLKLPAGSPEQPLIAERIRRLRSIPEKFPEEEAVMSRVAVRTFRKEKMRARVRELRALLARSPDYPRRAWAFYYLGQNLQGLDRNLEAYSAFRAALRLKPGLGYNVPVERCLDEAGEAVVRESGRRAAWWILLVLLVLGGAGFYLSRPWRWLRPVHLVMPLLGFGLWWGFLVLCSQAMNGLAVSRGSEFAEPVFMSTALGAPGSGLLEVLLAYGIVAMTGCFMLACGCTLLRRRWLRVAAGALTGLLLWTALLTTFYLQHVEGRSILDSGRGAGGRLRAVAYFDQEAIEPFVLTDPKSFPGMDARTIHHDPVLRDWILTHVPGAVGKREAPEK